MYYSVDVDLSEKLKPRPKPQPAAAPAVSAPKPGKGRSQAARLSMRATAAAAVERGPSKGSYARMPPRANEEKRWKRNDRFNNTVRAAEVGHASLVTLRCALLLDTNDEGGERYSE